MEQYIATCTGTPKTGTSYDKIRFEKEMRFNSKSNKQMKRNES